MGLETGAEILFFVFVLFADGVFDGAGLALVVNGNSASSMASDLLGNTSLLLSGRQGLICDLPRHVSGSNVLYDPIPCEAVSELVTFLPRFLVAVAEDFRHREPDAWKRYWAFKKDIIDGARPFKLSKAWLAKLKEK
jgi:hypothetical protein